MLQTFIHSFQLVNRVINPKLLKDTEVIDVITRIKLCHLWPTTYNSFVVVGLAIKL